MPDGVTEVVAQRSSKFHVGYIMAQLVFVMCGLASKFIFSRDTSIVPHTMASLVLVLRIVCLIRSWLRPMRFSMTLSLASVEIALFMLGHSVVQCATWNVVYASLDSADGPSTVLETCIPEHFQFACISSETYILYFAVAYQSMFMLRFRYAILLSSIAAISYVFGLAPIQGINYAECFFLAMGFILTGMAKHSEEQTQLNAFALQQHLKPYDEDRTGGEDTVVRLQDALSTQVVSPTPTSSHALEVSGAFPVLPGSLTPDQDVTLTFSMSSLSEGPEESGTQDVGAHAPQPRGETWATVEAMDGEHADEANDRERTIEAKDTERKDEAKYGEHAVETEARISSCSSSRSARPPLAPGGRSSSMAPAEVRDCSLDGTWVFLQPNKWLESLHISGDHVIDGCGQRSRLKRCGRAVYLDGGKLEIKQGMLCRTGKSGIPYYLASAKSLNEPSATQPVRHLRGVRQGVRRRRLQKVWQIPPSVQ
eukprot:CAMPEP_0117514186 /NCGR_PEP_ID=MMETSP0784-20121206/29940_1 /TAXON_ID=39447 /ORGANISM="" /LENGTH=480 /DNA_ID=CAMNT_0005309975 /DNA_START=102 /DNA_END=1545 /DNA_ORIENTATION=-